MTKLKTDTAKEIKEEAVEAIEAAETLVLRTRKLARKGFRAYVGLLGMAYDRAAKRFEKVTEGSEELFGELVERGEVLEREALVKAREARIKATEALDTAAARIRRATSEDRVEELEAEVQKMDRKLKAVSAKAKASAKPTTTKKTTVKVKTAKA